MLLTKVATAPTNLMTLFERLVYFPVVVLVETLARLSLGLSKLRLETVTIRVATMTGTASKCPTSGIGPA